MPPRQRPPATATRVVLYRRVSALMGRGGEDFHSPDVQLAGMRRHIAPLGLHEVGIVDDIDVTGRTFSREGLDKIRAMVEQRQVDAIAVYDISRLGRNVGDALQFIAWLKEHAVSVISANERLDDTPTGKFMTTQWLALAELYSNQIGQKWAETIDVRARNGHHHGVAPMGYVRIPNDNGKGTHLEADPHLAPVIAQAFRDFAAGKTVAQITADISRARGKPTDRSTIKSLLQNPVYLGRVVLWGTGKGRRPAGWRENPAYVGPGKHPRLVEDDVWDICVRRHNRDSFTPPRLLGVPAHPLVGLVYCAVCEHRMQYHQGRYECGQQNRLKTCTGAGRPRAQELLDAVLEEARGYLALLRGDVGAQQAQLRRAQAAQDVDAAKARLVSVRAEMTKLTKGWLAGGVPDSAYQGLVGPLRAEEESLEARLERSLETEAADPGRLVVLVEEMLAMWDDMLVPERALVLRDVVSRVLVRAAAFFKEPEADRISVEWR